MQAVHQLAESKVMVRRWLHISAALDTNDAAPAGTGGALVVTNATVPVTVAPASGAVAQ